MSQPPYSQPPWSQQPPAAPSSYAAPGYGAPPQAGAESRNTLGLISAVVGAATLLLGIVYPFLSLALAHGTNYGLYGIVTGALNVFQFLLGAAAVVVGIFAITRKGRPRLLAGIGIGLGVSAVWGALIAFTYPLILQFA